MTRHFDIALPAASAASARGGGKRESAKVCRERSANDLLASVSMLNANQRARMETSAAMWAERATILQQVEDGIARRTAETAAKRPAAVEDAEEDAFERS
jgi:hypothetical protein